MTNEISVTYCCPICGAPKLKSFKGFQIHCGRIHPDVDKATLPALWESAVAAQASSGLPPIEKVTEEVIDEETGEVTEVTINHVLDPVNHPYPVPCPGRKPAKVRAVKLVEPEIEDEPEKPEIAPDTYDEIDNIIVGEPVKLAIVPNPAPVPVAEPEPAVLTSIPTGARIILTGGVFKQNPNPPNNWEMVNVDNVVARVGRRQAVADGSTWLYLRCEDVVFSIAEADVLMGKFKIKSLPTPAPQEIGPPMGKVEIEESPEDKARREILPKFKTAVIEYVKTDADAKKAAKAFETVKKTHYDFISEVTREYGTETDTDKGDFRLRDFGYSSHLIRIPGKDRVEINTDAVVTWCLQTGNTACLKQTLDVDAWTNLKATGAVPDAIIQLYEKLIPGQDTFRLQVKRETVDEE